MTRDEAPFMDVPVMAPRAGQAFDVLLMPVSRPDLGEIRIDEDLFAIGRGEAPFAAYPTDAVSVLSRRHARIFSEDGAVYVADLGSKNGTRVNGDSVAQQPARLSDGDEVSFGADLAYRVRLYPRPADPEPPRVAVTLTPMREDLGLQPVVIAGFPFMVNKADDTFARYRDQYPHQVNYLSRRHAHVYLKHGVPWIEDLGSTNGTFVNGVRLRDQSVRLEPDDVVAFGGSHFVYRVGIERESDADATATRTSLGLPAAAGVPGVAPPAPPLNGAGAGPDVDPDKTTFVGAADSFLDIFCMDYRAAQEDEVNPEAMPDAADPAHPPVRRGRITMMVLEAMRSFGLHDRHQLERAARVAILAIAVLVIAGGYIWWRGAPDRSLQALVDEGKYVRAAEVADKVLARHPDEARYQALGAEALMRGYVPQWSARLQAGDAAGATAVLDEMRARSQHNADGQALIGQLAWVGDLERYVAQRGGIEGPVRMYADEAKIRDLLRRWGDDTASHQRLLGRIANDVPSFRDTYARALSDLRRLQNDESVLLAAVDRLNAAVGTELGRDQPEALQPMLAEYKDKYARLSGLDSVESDLRQYTAMIESLRDRAPGPLVALMQKASFATPPFQAAYQKLKAARLPGDEVQKQYLAASKAWDQGDGAAALAALKAVTAGPWAADVAKDVAHKEKVLAQYAIIKAGRGSPGYEEQLLAFYESLDPKTDGYFASNIDADVNSIRDTALRRANQLLNRAATGWRQYRNNGLIAGEQRLESGISAKFRSQAKLLAEAQDDARKGLRIYAQLKIEDSAQWSKVRDDIQAEIDTQRRSLNDLRMVLDPAVLKAKLALVGEGSPEHGKAAARKPEAGSTP
ncbi:FHA domain-containing protein [Cupriavidus sp.]|uniref:FHA domain-containing protein n=2 Tax=unclassified Cupriavidus TaxID=2640874 RepID=UPI0025BA03EE|nr:FHA domain-containing protein [Cupriavidus sp.]MCA3192659.1 FHA domain-containing protein [Cupriavidus sp.]MCA3194860.1 FHA domain-containing protein [Cupriavidus sp.]MCA3200498.1 FHA domain-containing protein [Cupriavidus sp.]MCA3210105.1 FHA domain-containing protein [Cupriavidus sp.]